MVENNSTGTMDKLGIGFDVLQAVNPDLVMVSSQLMGSHGAWSWWRGYGPEHPTARWSRAPLELRRHRCACGIDVDLPRPRRRLPRARCRRWRRWSGARAGVNHGVHVEVAQVETVVGMLGDLIAAEGVTAGSVVPDGQPQRGRARRGVSTAAQVRSSGSAITCRDDADWQGLVAAMGTPAWARRRRRSRPSTAAAHVPTSSTSASASGPRRRTKDDVAGERASAHGVPAAPMLTGAEQVSDPQFEARGFAVKIDQPGVGPLVARRRRVPR